MTSDDTTTPVTDETTTPIEETSTPGLGSQDDPLELLQFEIADLKEKLARSQADYNNLMRRSKEEMSSIGEWSESKVILKFLGILDNLERAMEHLPTEISGNTWIDGIKSTMKSLQKILSDFGIQRMDVIGQEVNPDFHEVISQAPDAKTLIKAEVEAGYTRNGKALRHAKVIVGDGSIDS